MRTAAGKLSLFVAIDRTGKFALVQRVDSATRVTASPLIHTTKCLDQTEAEGQAGTSAEVNSRLSSASWATLLMEDRNGPIVSAVATRTSGHAEGLAAPHLVEPHADRPNPITLGTDKGFEARDFVAELREINVTPHLA